MENNNALVHKNNIELPDRETAKQELERIKIYKEAIQSYLIPNVDYGKAFKKQPKPSLFKAGAEKIIDMLKLSTKIELLTKIEDYDKGIFAYTVRCILHRGERIIEGIGSCNSKEEKFRRQDSFSIANTILKMASKRAMVDAVLKIGCLSEAFTQDLEDYTVSNNHSPSNNYNNYNNNNNNTNSKEEKTEKDWTKIHLQKFFSELTRIFNTKELQDKQFKNSFICRLGEVKDWKELNSFRVKKWKEKLYNKDKDFVDRIKGVIFELRNKKGKEDKQEEKTEEKDKIVEAICWSIAQNTKLSLKAKVCAGINAFRFYLIHRLTGKRVKDLNGKEHMEGLKDIAKKINENNEDTLNEIEQIAMLWAGENSEEYFEAKKKREQEQEREIISK